MDFGLATAYYPEEYRYQNAHNARLGNTPDMTKIIQQLHESLDPRTVFACFGKVIANICRSKVLHCATRTISLLKAVSKGLRSNNILRSVAKP